MAPRDGTCLVWLLTGAKAGDNAQLRTLGAALSARCNWRVVEKPLAFRFWELLLHVPSRPTVAGLRVASRDGLRPPWPDLVLTAGRRNELVARWVRARSGNHSRLVHLGRPWSRPERFDLVVSTPQYRLAPGWNVLVNPLPLHRLEPGALAGAAAAWRDRLPALPRPWIAVLLGGNSGAVVFTTALARALAEQLGRFAADLGGSLLLTTSPRTPPPFARALTEALTGPYHLQPWSAEPRNNPYQGFLALADRLVVTAESVSMITEALATGKPVYLAPVTVPGRPWWLRGASYRWRPLSHRAAMALAPERFARDVTRIHASLIESGRVAWLGGSEPTPATAGVEDPLALTVARVRQVMGDLQPGSGSGG